MDNYEVTKKMNELNIVTEETFDRLEEYKSLCDWMDTFKFVLGRAMEQNGIKKWETPYYNFTHIGEGTTSKQDTDRMKKETVWIVNAESGELEEVNAYDYFQRFKKTSVRSAYVKISEVKE